MSPRSITTGQIPVSCDVCRRTLLRGEKADVFLSGGARRMVCELCGARAAHEGWIREGVDDSLGVRPRAERARSLLGRLRQRPLRSSAEASGRRRADGPGHGAGEPAPHAERAEAGNGLPVGAGGQREPRHVRAVPTNADLKMARALDLFNSSEHPRTVAGVARSLGPPFVVVRSAQATGSMVSILVGWELCWYRYEVDLADEASGVRSAGQGDEIGDLDAADQVPNAAADEQGALRVAASSADGASDLQ